MTSPPHQPESGGQQGPHDGPVPHGQQGGYGQFDPQSPDQPGQYGQQSPGQYGEFGQPAPGQFDQQPGQFGEFGQQAGYGPAPGFPTPQAPKRRTGLIVGVVIAVVVLLGGGTGAYFLFFNNNNGNSNGGEQTAQQVAEGFAQSYTSLARGMSTADLSRTKSFLCPHDQTSVQAIYDQQKSAGGADKGFSLQVSGVTTNGDKGTFKINLTDNGTAHQHSGNLVRQNNRWLVCDTVGAAG